MSKYTVKPSRDKQWGGVPIETIHYGYDSTIGYWCDIMGEDGCLFVGCSRFDGITGDKLWDILFDITVFVPQAHRSAMLLGQEF